MAARMRAGLSAPGKRLWTAVTASYELDPAELVLLDQAARTLDELARLEKALSEGPVMVLGSTGQDVVNPLAAAVRAHRHTVESLLRSLALPVAGEKSGRVRSPAAAHNQRSRWRQERLRAVRVGDGSGVA